MRTSKDSRGRGTKYPFYRNRNNGAISQPNSGLRDCNQRGKITAVEGLTCNLLDGYRSTRRTTDTRDYPNQNSVPDLGLGFRPEFSQKGKGSLPPLVDYLAVVGPWGTSRQTLVHRRRGTERVPITTRSLDWKGPGQLILVKKTQNLKNSGVVLSL